MVGALPGGTARWPGWLGACAGAGPREPATFLEMIAPPPLTAVLDQVIGEDVRLSGVQPRTVPGPETECGYTTWHRVRENPHPLGLPLSRCWPNLSCLRRTAPGRQIAGRILPIESSRCSRTFLTAALTRGRLPSCAARIASRGALLESVRAQPPAILSILCSISRGC